MLIDASAPPVASLVLLAWFDVQRIIALGVVVRLWVNDSVPAPVLVFLL